MNHMDEMIFLSQMESSKKVMNILRGFNHILSFDNNIIHFIFNIEKIMTQMNYLFNYLLTIVVSEGIVEITDKST